MSQKFQAPAKDVISATTHRVLLTVEVAAGASAVDAELGGRYAGDIEATDAYGDHLIRNAGLQVWHNSVDVDDAEHFSIKAELVDPKSHQDASVLGAHVIGTGLARLHPLHFRVAASCQVTPVGSLGGNGTIHFDAEPWLRQIRSEQIPVMLGEAGDPDQIQDLHRSMVQWLIDRGHHELWAAAADGDAFSNIDLSPRTVGNWLRMLTEAQPAPEPAGAPAP